MRHVQFAHDQAVSAALAKTSPVPFWRSRSIEAARSVSGMSRRAILGLPAQIRRYPKRAAALGSCHPTPERAPRLHVGQLRESRRRCRAAVAGRRPDRAAPSGAIVQAHGCARHPVGVFLGRALIPSTLTRGRASGEVGERFSKLAPTIYRSLDFIEPVHLQPELARLVFAAISQGPESVLFA